MGNKRNDIGEEEIRIIGQRTGDEERNDACRHHRTRWSHGMRWGAALAVVVMLAGLAVALIPAGGQKDTPLESSPEAHTQEQTKTVAAQKGAAAYTTVRDTTVKDIPMHIFTPHNAVPMLVKGNIDIEGHPDYILGAMAADYGRDRGEWRISGGFIYRGELISHSVSKWGFCAILNGKVTLGRSLSTGLFEQCIAQGGDFFRHDALVSDGKVANRHRKPRSIRRALMTRGDVASIVETEIVVSNAEFAEALQALGAEQAISLVGSAHSVRWAYDARQRLFVTGNTDTPQPDVVNFIVWRASDGTTHK